MPIISFARGRAPLTVSFGANLMESLVTAGIPVASSCGANGVCTKCKLQIVKGMENLSKPEDLEEHMMEMMDFANDERMSCQTKVMGDITIDATYW